MNKVFHIREMKEAGDLEGLFDALVAEGSWDRRDAAQAIIDIGGEEARERLADRLIASLGSEDWSVVEDAAIGLRKLRSPRSVEALMKTLDYPMSDVVIHAARALGAIGDARAVEPLVRSLDHGNEKIRLAAISALSELGDPRASDALLARLKAPDLEVVECGDILQALGKLGDSRVAEAAVTLLEHGHQFVRKSAAAALSQEAVGRSLVSRDRAIGLLLAMLKEPSFDMRMSACPALGCLGDERIIPDLDDVRRTDEWVTRDQDTREPVRYDVREAACQAITRIRGRVSK